MGLAVWALAGQAQAYQAESAISTGCHERLIFDAVRALRGEGVWEVQPAEPALAPALADLPFTIPEDLRGDLGVAALVVGMRDNDFKGNEATDTLTLGRIHADPARQHEHCLRAPGHDEPDGSSLALKACRAYIQEQFGLALRHLGPDGRPDLARRESLQVFLNFNGATELSLPAFHLRLGQALHALQDGFSHTYRSADGRVTVVLNYIDFVNGDADEARDGPEHLAALDVCDDLDPLRQRRFDDARAATAGLLRAALTGEVARREQQAAARLDESLGFQPGCTHANRWCEAPEPALEEGSCGCGAVGRGATPWLALSLLGAALVGRARRFRVALAALCVASPARAQQTPDMPDGAPLGLYVAGSASLDRPALAALLGLRYRVSSPWVVGVDAEWNPWFNLQTRTAAPGVANTYATLIRRWRLRPHNLKLRTSGHLGASTLLFDLSGAPAGSVGPYLGVNFLGLEYELSPNLSLVIDPADVAFATPRASGAILMYRQYRFTVGVQFGG